MNLRMSLQPFMPTPKFEEHKETFKDYYMLKRRPDACVLTLCTPSKA